MIDETVLEVVPYNIISETYAFAEPTLFDIMEEIKAWQDTMGEEVATLIKNKIWGLVPCAISVKKCTKIVGCMRVNDIGGTIDCYKFQFVALGFEIDLDKTFDLV